MVVATRAAAGNNVLMNNPRSLTERLLPVFLRESFSLAYDVRAEAAGYCSDRLLMSSKKRKVFLSLTAHVCQQQFVFPLLTKV